MIKSKEDLKEYMEADKKALFLEKNKPGILDEIWKWEILLRKTEYYKNCGKSLIGKIQYCISRYFFNKESVRLGFSIPLNVCGKGLSIAHYGSIVINSKSLIGENCRIYNNTVIGSKNQGGGSPVIGNNVTICSGCCVLGEITIADNVVCGANSVILNSVYQKGSIVVGSPAKEIIKE